MASFSIGSAGSNIPLYDKQLIGTLDANTYPSGTITFSGIQNQTAYWQNDSDKDGWFGIYLTNSSGTLWCRIFEFYASPNTSYYTPYSANIEFAESGIVGQPLYLQAYKWDGSGYNLLNHNLMFRNASTISIATNVWNSTPYAPTTVNLVKDGLGKLTVSWSGASTPSGTTISGYDVMLATNTSTAWSGSFHTTVNASTTSYTFSVNNNTTYYAAVRTKTSSANSGFKWSSGVAAQWYTNCTAPTSVSYSSPNNGVLRVSWSGATAGINTNIANYTVKIATSSGGTAVQSATTAATYYDFTVNNTTTYYASVMTNSSVSGYSSGWYNATNSGKASYYTACGAPTTVNVSQSSGTVTISWSGATAGTNNSISNYGIIRNTSQSEAGATVVSTNATGSSKTNAPGPGSFYYGVRTQGSAGESYYSSYKWSSVITISGKPSVSVGAPISKDSMDALKAYLNKGTSVSIGGIITRALALTYKSTSITQNVTPINASWYNN